ncbi:MAG: hypothetical protein IJS37_04770 [Bacilli bacterium]|nr:hypothetical protein [Bacilli bacterium]
MFIKLNSIKEEYEKRYRNRLSICYPSIGSTGFQERNQTSNFLAAAESLVPNLFTWFEFQVEGAKKADNHLDAIAIDFGAKEIWLIESKRIQTEKKFKAIESDRKRMTALANRPETIFDRFYEKSGVPFDEFHIYGLTLADVWNYEGQRDARQKAYQYYLTKSKDAGANSRCLIIEIPIKGTHHQWQYRLIIDAKRLK